jgi:hypothetical protein
MRVADEIQSHSKPIIKMCYARFLTESADVETREYPDAINQVREVLVHGNYMSQADIEICMAFDIAIYKAEKNFSEIQALHDCLQANYGSA